MTKDLSICNPLVERIARQRASIYWNPDQEAIHPKTKHKCKLWEIYIDDVEWYIAAIKPKRKNFLW